MSAVPRKNKTVPNHGGPWGSKTRTLRGATGESCAAGGGLRLVYCRLLPVAFISAREKQRSLIDFSASGLESERGAGRRGSPASQLPKRLPRDSYFNIFSTFSRAPLRNIYSAPGVFRVMNTFLALCPRVLWKTELRLTHGKLSTMSCFCLRFIWQTDTQSYAIFRSKPHNFQWTQRYVLYLLHSFFFVPFN